MRDIHCPKDIGFENIFDGEDCKAEQFFNFCYYCWSSAIAKRCQQERQRDAEIVKSYIHEIITESGIDKNQHTNEVLRKIVDEIMIHNKYEYKAESEDEE